MASHLLGRGRPNGHPGAAATVALAHPACKLLSHFTHRNDFQKDRFTLTLGAHTVHLTNPKSFGKGLHISNNYKKN